MSGIDKSVCLAILDRALRNSWYYLQSGRKAPAYANIDSAMLGYRDETKVPLPPQHQRMEDLVEQFAEKIKQIDRESPFHRLAFIDKAGRGPVGMIALSSHIIWKSQKEAVFVRPYKNTLRSVIEGRRLGADEKVLVVSDIATTGETILKAASKLWLAGAIVAGALVFFDQELGAKENLALKDITLHSLYTRQEYRSQPDREEKLPDLEIETLRAFGGVM